MLTNINRPDCIFLVPDSLPSLIMWKMYEWFWFQPLNPHLSGRRTVYIALGESISTDRQDPTGNMIGALYAVTR